MSSRLVWSALILSLLACLGLIGVICLQASRWRELKEEQAALKARITSTESVYDVQDCILEQEGEGCKMGEYGTVFLGSPDSDGEVRVLIQKTKDGKEQQIGPLSKEETYVRLKHADETMEGYALDRETGAVEVYLAHPPIQSEQDERLPVIIRRLFIDVAVAP
jgi:hypothetical protein